MLFAAIMMVCAVGVFSFGNSGFEALELSRPGDLVGITPLRYPSRAR